MREENIINNYGVLSYQAIIDCEKGYITFNKWINYYGLYCSGKDFNSQCEANGLDMKVDTAPLAEALRDAQTIRLTAYEAKLIEASRVTIEEDLSLNNSNNRLLKNKLH